MKLKRNPTQFTKRLQANLKVKWFRIVLNVKTIHSIRLIKTVSHTIFLNVIGGSASECNKTLEHSGIFLKSTGNLIKFQFCFGHFNAFDKCCRRKLDQSPSFYSWIIINHNWKCQFPVRYQGAGTVWLSVSYITTTATGSCSNTCWGSLLWVLFLNFVSTWP